MKKKKFEVQIYYTGFCTYQINATNEEEAILKARNNNIKIEEIQSNLENWKDADIAVEITHGRKKSKNTF